MSKWYVVHITLKLAALLEDIFSGQRLIGEAHVHHSAWVALGGGQVYQAAFPGDVDAPAVGQCIFVQEVAHTVILDAELVNAFMLISTSK